MMCLLENHVRGVHMEWRQPVHQHWAASLVYLIKSFGANEPLQLVSSRVYSNIIAVLLGHFLHDAIQHANVRWQVRKLTHVANT